MLTQESVTEALKAVKFPGYSRDIVSFGMVKDIACGDGAVSVVVEMTSNDPEKGAAIKKDAEAVIRKLPDVTMAYVEIKQPPAGTGPAGAPGGAPGGGAQYQGPQRAYGIKKVIAVASGKGGVGKSTLSVNLACALQHLGHKVGLLDCDIYGPSIPLMMGAGGRPQVTAAERLVPLETHGVRLMSMGFIVDDDQPVIWRGPMIQKTVHQFINQTEWGELDFLLVDLPPGTGDAQLSLCQTTAIDGGVIVTTPQEASLGVVRKGVAMFNKVNVPILGIVENMSYFTAPGGERVEIFGHGGGKAEAERTNARFLGEVPIFTEIREGGDSGVPVVAGAPDSPAGKALIEVGHAVEKACA